jgi:hypothetical protein
LCICTQDSCTAAGLRTSANRHEDELAFDVTLESLTSARGSMDEYNVRFDVETIGAGEPENPTAAGAGGAGGTGASATAGTDAQ